MAPPGLLTPSPSLPFVTAGRFGDWHDQNFRSPSVTTFPFDTPPSVPGAPLAIHAFTFSISPGVAICTAPNNQTNPTIVADGAGGAIVTWPDNRSSPNYRLYAQRVNAAGVPQWAPNGVGLWTAANSQSYPTIVADGAGGAIVTWPENRRGPANDI